jgi:hypothetical protein
MATCRIHSPDQAIITRPIRPPTRAVDTNAHPTATGPIQAPRPAISFTSPAPMPPIAYSGSRVKRPAAAPAIDQARRLPPPAQYA